MREICRRKVLIFGFWIKPGVGFWQNQAPNLEETKLTPMAANLKAISQKPRSKLAQFPVEGWTVLARSVPGAISRVLPGCEHIVRSPPVLSARLQPVGFTHTVTCCFSRLGTTYHK